MKSLGYIAIIVVVAAVAWFQVRFQPNPLPIFKEAPEFTLTERSGEPFSSNGLKGKVWLADFFYSTCPGPCPMITTSVAELQEAFLATSPDTRIVSFSLDPEKDTPERLRAYAEEYHASPDRWIFLTSGTRSIEELVNKGFLVSYTRTGDKSQPVVHGTQLALVDRKGRIRAFYDGATLKEPERVIADARSLLKEKE